MLTMEVRMNKIKIASLIITLASCSYFLIDNKSNEVLAEKPLTILDNIQEFNADNVATDLSHSESFEAENTKQIIEESDPENKQNIIISDNELANAESSKSEETKMSGVQQHKYIVNKFESEEIDYNWSDSKKYAIADSFNNSLHDTTHTLVDEVICKTTVCKVDYEFEYDSEEAMSFIELLSKDFRNSGWRNVNHGSVITNGNGVAKVTLWLYDFDETTLNE
jgi:hypothetical protein